MLSHFNWKLFYWDSGTSVYLFVESGPCPLALAWPQTHGSPIGSASWEFWDSWYIYHYALLQSLHSKNQLHLDSGNPECYYFFKDWICLLILLPTSICLLVSKHTVCGPGAHGDRKRAWLSPWDWSCNWLWSTVWVLGLEPVFSLRAVGVLNHRGSSPVQPWVFL